MPIFGSWYWDTGGEFPGFAYGMRMTAKQYAKVLHALMFQGLLDDDDGDDNDNGAGLAAMYGGSITSSSVTSGMEAFAADRTLGV